MPLLTGSRRIARVVLLSAAAGIALADGDLSAAIDLGNRADADAIDLGIDREIPLIRCVLARSMLAGGDVTGAAAKAAEAIAAARSLTFPYPMALCLETAALVVLHGAPDFAAAGRRLLPAAEAIRERGDRPGPVTLSAAVAQARLAAGAEAAPELVAPPELAAAAELALALLADIRPGR